MVAGSVSPLLVIIVTLTLFRQYFWMMADRPWCFPDTIGNVEPIAGGGVDFVVAIVGECNPFGFPFGLCFVPVVLLVC